MAGYGPLQDYFEQDATRLIGEVYRYMRVVGRLSALMPKGELEEGKGANYQTLVWERSQDASAATWTPVQPNSLTNNPNTCNPAPLQVQPANTVLNYSMYQTLLQSNIICMQDVRIAYNFEEQIMSIRDNFKALIVDVWEYQDKFSFFSLPGHKIVTNSSLTDFYGASDFGPVVPTSKLTAGILRNIYEQLSRDAAGEEPVAMVDGAPQFILLCSPETRGDVIDNDPAVRQDIRYAQMGEGSDGWLLQSWNVDRSYINFLMTIDMKMPRFTFNFGTGQWVQVPYYLPVPATNGQALIVNPAYESAPYEDSYIFLKQTIRRDMPRPFGTGGADTRFNPVNFNGDIIWTNILTPDANPLGLQGSWYAALMAAYKPIKVKYAYVIRHLVCNSAYFQSCY